jgi:uncharacterized protein YbaP (TraB family)
MAQIKLPPVFGAAAPAVAAVREDRGLLWTLRRDGRTSFLYGTLHVGRPGWVVPGPKVAAALAASDVLALEIDPTDPAVRELASLADPKAPALPPALQQRLQRRIAAACLPEGALAGMHPAMQVMLLGVLEARWAGLDPNYAQEQALARDARAAGREVVSLESVALQKKALMPEDDSATDTQVTQALTELESGSARATIARLALAWEHGDLAALESYESWCDCMNDADERAAMRALNDGRNPALAAQIDTLHRAGRRVFAAVGALHMTGAQGLLRLLAARGFQVERVMFAAPGAQ